LTDLFDIIGKIPKPVGQAALGIGATATAIIALKAAAAAAIPIVKSLFALVVANPFVALAAGITAATVALAGYRNESEQIADAAVGGGAAEIQAARAKLIETREKDLEKAAEGFEAQMAHQDELKRAIAEQKSQYEELNNTFRNGIVNSILDAVEGTRSLSESLAGILRQMARMILQQQLMNALSGFNPFKAAPSTAGPGGYTIPSAAIPKFANGGRPPVNRPSVVGERGPELFVPDRAGTIVPNNALGGANVVVNVDASGTQAQGDQPNAKALGAAIGAAVQAELVKQKRPGGLLS
jgi:hypothetical protein